MHTPLDPDEIRIRLLFGGVSIVVDRKSTFRGFEHGGIKQVLIRNNRLVSNKKGDLAPGCRNRGCYRFFTQWCFSTVVEDALIKFRQSS